MSSVTRRPTTADLAFNPHYLKNLRTRLGWTQVQLAKAMRVEPSYISSWENGKHRPSSPLLIRLSEVFAVHPRDFFEERSVDWNGDV